jgi:hypothetical protein
MRYLRGPLLALLTFVFGVVISPIHFWNVMTACGRTIDGGGPYSVTSYKSSYFVRLAFQHFTYASPEKANAVFDQYVAEAVQVIELTSKFDKERKKVGQRAVTMSYNSEMNVHFACVFWTDGSSLHSIDSPSLLHVLEFEKQHALD